MTDREVVDQSHPRVDTRGSRPLRCRRLLSNRLVGLFRSASLPCTPNRARRLSRNVPTKSRTPTDPVLVRKARTVSRVCRRSLCGVRLPVGWPRLVASPYLVRSAPHGRVSLFSLTCAPASRATWWWPRPPARARARGLLRRALLVGEPRRREDRRRRKSRITSTSSGTSAAPRESERTSADGRFPSSPRRGEGVALGRSGCRCPATLISFQLRIN